MISVIMCCYSMPDSLKQTLPAWLNQKGVDYEIVLVHGPKIQVAPHKLINPIAYKEKWNICRWNNEALANAKGDIIVATQCDMLVNEHQLSRMLAVYRPDIMVKEWDFPNLHMCMVSKKALIKAGGWHEPFGELYGFEDTDLSETLKEQGLAEYFIDTGAKHLSHNKEITDYDRERYAKSKALFEARHG